MDKKIMSVEGKLKLLSADEWKQEVELWLLNSEVNRNNWKYENLREHLQQFVNTPILCAYVGNKIGDGHNMIMHKDGTPDFRDATAERIVGVIVKDVEIRVKDGIEWIVAKGTIYTWYAFQLVEKLKVQGALSVSIETLIDEYHDDNGIEVFTKWTVLGTTILNEAVNPAVVDANIRALSELGKDELCNLTMLRVASAQEQMNNPQTKTEKGVKNAMIKLKELQDKVTDFSVLAVNSGYAAMVSDDNEPYLCKVDKENGEIVVGAKIALDAVHFVDGETDVTVKASDLLGKLIAKCSKTENDYAAEHEARVNAEETLDKMKRAENKRRIEAVKSAILARLAEINENRDCKIDESVCDELITDEKLAEYAAMEDKDGNCTGIEAACNAVDSICMQKIIEVDKTRKNSASKGYFFSNGEGFSANNQAKGVLAAVQNLHNNNL